MWVKTHRRHHRHRDTQNKRPDGWSYLKLDDVTKFDKHHQQGDEQNIHHAPSPKLLHQSISRCSMPARSALEKAKFE